MDGDPLDRLHRLVDASLLVADAASGRYRVLFIVRAFLSDELEALGEAEAARETFLSRCVDVADEIRERMSTASTSRPTTVGCAPSSTTSGPPATWLASEATSTPSSASPSRSSRS